MIEIRPIEASERPWASRLLGERFGSDRAVSRGLLHETARLPALVAVLDAEPIGLLVYRIDGNECEVVTLVVCQPGLGAGTLLLEAVRAPGREAGCWRVWLVTTNDNLTAREFYRARGWTLSAVYPGAVSRARHSSPRFRYALQTASRSRTRSSSRCESRTRGRRVARPKRGARCDPQRPLRPHEHRCPRLARAGGVL